MIIVGILFLAAGSFFIVPSKYQKVFLTEGEDISPRAMIIGIPLLTVGIIFLIAAMNIFGS
jgi:hypothetical protein